MKTTYSTPKMETLKMEAEMPVICASGGEAKTASATLTAVANW